MTRQRAFCRYCGKVIHARAVTCRAHDDLPALDPTRGLPVRLLAMQAAEQKKGGAT